MKYFTRVFWTSLDLQRIWAWTTFVILIIGSSIYFFQWPFLTYPEGTTFQTSVQEVARGSNMSLRVRRCNTSPDKKSYTISRRLVRDDAPQADRSLESSDEVVEPNKCETLNKEYRMADDTPEGDYHIEGTSIVHGWFRTFYIPFQSTKFKVVNKKL